MYKLILVDDEPEICQGLREVVPFESLGFTVVGEAGNGVEALRLCEAVEPDLIITDIRMPLMDGLTLCRSVRAILPTAQFIILSGYDEFEYARQAIAVKTMGYLLKPISSAEFVEVLKSTRAALDEEFAKRQDSTRLREHFHESLPLLREMLLTSLLSGGVAAEAARESARKYGVPLQAERYAVALLRIGEAEHPDGIGDTELLRFAVRNILCEVLAERMPKGTVQVFNHNGMLALLLLFSGWQEDTFAQAVAHLEDARKSSRYYLHCALYVGVSAACQSLAGIPAAARQALTALDQCALGQAEQTLCITDIEQTAPHVLAMDEFALRQLINSMKAGEEEQAQATLQALLHVCRRAPLSPKAYQTYLLDMLVSFLRVVPELSLDAPELNEAADACTQTLLSACPTVDEAEELFARLLRLMMHAIQSQRTSSSLKLAAEAEQYLQARYAEPGLTLEKLCLHLHISPSYFSMLFKKETKKTFHQYLTELRMNRALTLLSATEMKTAQIAEMVGLPDPSYFSYCFKKHFGFPPSGARKRREEHE